MDYESSELCLYKNIMIMESGDLTQALSHLKSLENKVIDKLTYKERKGKCESFLIQRLK